MSRSILARADALMHRQRQSGAEPDDVPVLVDAAQSSPHMPLDVQALDSVMSVLDELRRGGRTVGLISHLEEVKARIPARLEVIPGPGGSRAAFRVG